MATPEILGSRIRHYRKINALTQKELAAQLGVAPKYIAHIEQGVKGPSLEKLVEICKWFGVSMADILPIEEQDDLKAKEKMIREIVKTLRALEITQVGIVKAMVCSLN